MKKKIVTLHNSNISCKIKNSTNKYIKLNKNMKIGVFCPIKQNNITKLNENESRVSELNSDDEMKTKCITNMTFTMSLLKMMT